MFTVFQKNYTLFYFCNNFFIREPIFIIFGKNVAKDTVNMQSLTCVVSSVEDHILVENLYKFKGYRAKNSKFPDKGWTINGLNYLLKKLRDTGMGV